MIVVVQVTVKNGNSSAQKKKAIPSVVSYGQPGDNDISNFKSSGSLFQVLLLHPR